MIVWFLRNTLQHTLTLLSPSRLQALLFEKPNFTGDCVEVCSELHSLCEAPEDEDTADAAGRRKKSLSAVGSVKILGGL